MEKKVVIIGAASGIGRELAKEYSRNGYFLGLADMNIEELKTLQKELPPDKCIIQPDDITDERAPVLLEDLISAMGGTDIVVITAGIGPLNQELDLACQKKIIAVNVTAFSALVATAFKYFTHKGGGHIAGITSIAALRGNKDSPEYGASKAYVKNYLDALRIKAFRAGNKLTVSEIIPGYVRTTMVKSRRKMFWISTVEQAAAAIFRGLERKEEFIYVTRRWRYISWLIRLAPTFIVKRY